MIQVDNVTKKYLQKKALKNISLELPQGKVIGIVGENGAGKSTLLKAIAGLLQINSGYITVDGQTANRKISSVISFLSDTEEYYSSYKVSDMINYYASQYDDFSTEIAIGLAEKLNIYIDEKIAHLSKGNKSRVKFLLALSRQVPYILMDEPFSGLDPMVRKSIIEGILQNVDLTKQTLVITTHDIHEVEALLDMVVAIRRGQILEVAEVEDLRQTRKLSILDWMTEIYN